VHFLNLLFAKVTVFIYSWSEQWCSTV